MEEIAIKSPDKTLKHETKSGSTALKNVQVTDNKHISRFLITITCIIIHKKLLENSRVNDSLISIVSICWCSKH